jgi:Ca2+-binding RTX toxin-like protein
MAYDWTQLTKETITRFFLFGTDTPPSDLTSESLIRPPLPAPPKGQFQQGAVQLELDAVTFMTSGPGRFALPGVNSDLVAAFMNPDGRTHGDGTQHIYTLAEMIAKLGLYPSDALKINIQQYAYRDELATADYVSRVYLYNSSKFAIADGIEFVVQPDGSRWINNFAVLPNDDNFDFSSNSRISQLANSILQPQIDPSNIGRQVDLNFRTSKTLIPRQPYTSVDYANDIAKYNQFHQSIASAAFTLSTNADSLFNELWNSGVTKLVDPDGKAILFGTKVNDKIGVDGLFGEIKVNGGRVAGQLLDQARENGMRLIGGTGNDILTGAELADVLVGGDDNDVLEGGNGDDELHGGKGYDTYILRAGGGNDKIFDEDGKGKIIFIDALGRPQSMSLNPFQVPGQTNTWTSQLPGGGEIKYTKNSPLTITFPDGTQVVVDDFQDGEFGIHLGDEPPQDQPTVLEIHGDIVPEDQDPTQGDQLSKDQNLTYIGHPGAWADVILHGSNGNDHILAGDLSDWVVGGGGDDNIEMGSGDDVVSADGNMTLEDGDDVIQGNAGRDLLEGLGGNDRLFADDKIEITDAILAGSTDTSSGNIGGQLSGNDGDDILVGNSDDELLAGGAGSDLIIAGQGDDFVLGDADYFYTIWYRGVDRGYTVDGTAPLYFTMVEAKTFEWNSTLVNGERFYSNAWSLNPDPVGAAADVIYAGGGSDWVRGGRGNDVLYGEGGEDGIAGEYGNDTIMGGDGDDKIAGDASYINGSEHGDDYISGGDGDDTLFGGGGADVIFGDAGDDTINGDDVESALSESFHGDDYLDGGAGNDTLYGFAGDDTLVGGEGDDSIYSGKGDDLLDGGDGADELKGDDGNDSLIGGEDNDILVGDDGNDLLAGEAGDDQLGGGDGNDVIEGGDGDDQIGGGGGDDTIAAGEGDDLVEGGAGSDYILGDAGEDEIGGREGDDVIDGGEGNDLLVGDSGDDLILGGMGNDRMGGGLGNDTLDGGDGDDVIAGDAGDDILSGSDGGDLMDAGAGDDFVSGDAGNDEIGGRDGNDFLDGGDGDDLITGDGGDDTLLGGAGADRLGGGDGNDEVYGDDGDDILQGGTGFNLLVGGEGNDTLISNGYGDVLRGGSGSDIYIVGLGDVLIDDESGNDTVVLSNVTSTTGLMLSAIGDPNLIVLGHSGGGNVYIKNGLDGGAIENIQLADGTMVSYASLFDTYNTQILEGTDEDGYIVGGQYTNDLIHGGKGRDLLIGGGGHDTFQFNLGDGKDVLREDPEGFVTIKFGPGISGVQIKDINSCSVGKDMILTYGNNGDTILIKRGREGVINKIEFADGSSINATQLAKQFDIGNADLKTTISSDLIHGTTENDRIFAGGGNDIVYGEQGDDVLWGDNVALVGETTYEGNDVLHGGDGNDLLNGGGGNNTLYGDGGDDTLQGEYGDDYFVGGAGNDRIDALYGVDTIVFNRGDGQDLVAGNAQTTLSFGTGIALDDLEFCRMADNSMDILIKNSDDKVRIGYWRPGTHDNVLSNLQFNDGSTSELSSLGNLPIYPVYGSNGDDTMIGTNEVNDVLSAGMGNDDLSGKRGQDILDGGAGNDTLDGNEGNDQLIGGTGLDTYVVSLNMENDTVVEVNGESSQILLKDNILATDLVFERRGDDLYVGLQTVSPGTGQGLLLKNFANLAQTWTIVDGNGHSNDLSALFVDQQTKISSLATATETQQVAHARDQFLNRAKNELYNQWNSYGSNMTRPGVFEQGLGQDIAMTLSRETRGTLVYDDQGFLSNSNGAVNTFGFNATGAPGEEWFNHTINQIAIVQRVDDAAQIQRSSERTSTVQRTEEVGINIQAQTGTNIHNEYLESADAIPGGTPDAMFSRRETLTDETVIYGKLNTIIEQPSSDYVTLQDASRAWFTTGALPEKFLMTRYLADGSTNIEDLTAGSGSNSIDMEGLALIDGGAGDDSINQIDEYYLDRGFTSDRADPNKSPEMGAGQFIYGNDGNDSIWGREGADVLIGGQGNDFLNGRAGADTYFVLRNDAGTDVIYDSGFPASYDGWDWIYKNWFYEKEGFTDWVDQQYTGTLPDLPPFPIYDYEALDPIVRAGILARDTVEFAPGLALSDLQFAWGRGNVVLPDGSTAQMMSLDISWGEGQGVQVVIPANNPTPGAGIEQFKFSDGTTLTMAEILRYAPPMPPNEIVGSTDDDFLDGSALKDHMFGLGGNDSLFGGDGNDVLDGGEGDDYLSGDGGNDILDGGFGNDELYGGAGDDVMMGALGDDRYVWGWGSGHDTIVDNGSTIGNQDALRLYGLLPSDITVTRDTNNLYIGINGTDGADQLTIKDFFVAGGEIEQVRFDDDTVWDKATLLSHIQIGTTNHAPTVANPIGVQSAAEKQSWIFAVPAGTLADIDAGDQLTYQATLANGDPLPTWLSFDAATQTFNGMAGNSDVGQFDIALTATDQGGLTAGVTFKLSVTNVNDAPVVAMGLANQSASEDALFSYVIPANTFNDIDQGDALTLTASLADGQILPAWLTFDGAARTLSGTPGNDQVGNVAIRVTATDRSGATASSIFNLDVANVNDAPILTIAVANQSTLEDAPFSFKIPAGTFQDIDVGDSLTLSATLADGSALPTWISFDVATQTFSGIPDNAQVGNFSIKLTATDQSGASASTPFALNVANVNDAPVVSMALANQATLEDVPISYAVPTGTFSDIDAGDSLTLSASLADGSALPSWLSFNATTRTLSGTPGNSHVGTVAIKLTATDQAGALASTNVNLTVTNVNDAPTVSVLLADQTVVEYKAFSYIVPANSFADVDVGDTRVINATLDDGSALPDWLSFDPDTLTFSGTPSTMDIGVLRVRVTTTDQGGLSASDVFDLTVNASVGLKINGTSANDTLTGLSGNDTLNGAAGADTMSGGLGNDKYIVDNVGDVIIEKANEGTDTVQSAVSYTLSANVENLQLTGTASFNATGNELNNILTGNSGANLLTGGAGDDSLNGAAGADTMIGGTGNDTYTVDNIGDVVTELANEGTDRVKSYINYTLGANVENLTLLGTAAIDGTGNALANSMTGNSAANRLAGGDGNDVINGGAGNDIMLGEAGDDTLTGSTGADTLIGGTGNDVYVVTDDQDTVTELANEGTDRVNAGISYTLSDNVENLTLTGTAEIHGIGNSLDNVLSGNNARNYLSGLSGNDTLRGNGANDILLGGDGNDTISDNGGQNLLDGGAGTDTLTGSAGNEIFIGGKGNDTITTGAGSDIIIFNKGDGQDTVKASTGADNSISLGGGVNYTDLTLSKSGSDLIVGTGTNDSIKLAGWYSTTTNNKSLVNLQVIAEAMANFDAASTDPLRNNRIESFDFTAIVSKFDLARGTSATFSNWAMNNTLLDAHNGNSDAAALGGDLAYQYGKNGNLSSLSVNPAQGILGSTQLGTTAQALQPTANLQDTSPRLG